jgi:hypothetical protein
MELAPYLYKEYGYSTEMLLQLINSLNYKFYDLKNLNQISNVEEMIINIKDGSSQNILLM